MPKRKKQLQPTLKLPLAYDIISSALSRKVRW